MGRGCGFEARAEAGRLIGPFNAALLTPAISSAFLELAVAEQKHTSLGKRSREVIILRSGRSGRPPTRLYAHCAVARHLGHPTTRSEHWPTAGCRRNSRRGGGSPPCRPRTVGPNIVSSEALYREAEATLGADGVMETVILTGIYHTVCAILNAFEIPAPS